MRNVRISALAAALTLGLLPAMTEAQGVLHGVSQFNSGRPGAKEFEVFNPGVHEVFALLIMYREFGDIDKNGRLDHGGGGRRRATRGVCRGVIIPPNGTSDRQFDRSPGSENQFAQAELIAIPTSGPYAGVFDRTGATPVGVFAHLGRGSYAAPMPTARFALPTKPEDLAMLTNCACCELSESGLSSDFLEVVGLTCPADGAGLTCGAKNEPRTDRGRGAPQEDGPD